ncbi:hypothetical protein NDU88_004533 [Pleurodeles waltl]|uniref:Uncharacterized protein n=1 Tax=Pleurodeles waltl TaxID=8319 RepID=A0AAV7SJ77_PLEWA|nr:hypothetical protein NDU88_004533 [Pleurodeles waltl]
MATSSDADSWSRGTLEERQLGVTSKMAVPIDIYEEDVVIISDEEEEAQVSQKGVGGRGSVGNGGHSRQRSLPVKFRAPLEHRAEGRVKPGAVYPISRELAGVGPLGQRSDLEDVQPSTSRGTGGGLYRVEEELLDYDDDIDEEVLPMQWGDVVKSRAVPRVVQGDHSGAHHQELLAGNLPRGEEGLLGSLGSKVVREVMGGTLRKGVQGGLNEQTLRKVDASIQVCFGGPDRACAVWIVGNSFVRWAEKQASSRHFGRQLGLDGARIKLSWLGKSGMRWGELLYVLAKRMETRGLPRFIGYTLRRE